MSEPIRTELVKTRTIYKEHLPGPFAQLDGKVAASLERQGIEHEFIKRNVFGKEYPEVRPVIPRYEKIDTAHGRSMTESASSNKVVWGGPLPGDIYGARTVKGTAMRASIKGISLDSHSESPYGYRGFGLMDDSVIPRVIKVSELLRKNGLPTERPAKVKELKEVWVQKWIDGHIAWKKIPIKEWETSTLQAETEGGADFEKIKRYLQETKFIAIERDVQVDERLQNIAKAAYNDRLKEIMTPIFKWLNVATQVRSGGIIAGTPKPKPFRYNKGDLNRYFLSYLPSQMGTYLGRFHKLGLQHEFPHWGNWSAVGTLYDLDSVSGQALYSDDKPVEDKDQVHDINITYGAAEILLNRLAYTPGFERAYKPFFTQFLRSYFTEKYGAGVTSKDLNGNERLLLMEKDLKNVVARV